MDFKKLSLVMLSLMFIVILAAPVQAAEWDNIREYNPTTREVTIYNSFLGLKLDAVGKARLNTPLNVKVAVGYQKVAEFDLWAYEDYNDALKQFEFLDLKNGKTKINRDYDLKYLTYEEVEVNDYETIENGLTINGTINYERVISGTHIEQREKWEKITPADLKKNDYLTIGVFTDVKMGDYVDWIPMIYGEAVPEWASWEESLNTDLIAYYPLDESSGAVLDVQGGYDGTNNGATAGVAGKVGTAYDFEAGESDYITMGNVGAFELGLANARTYSFWIKRESTGSRTTMLGKSLSASPYTSWQIVFEATNKFSHSYIYALGGDQVINAYEDTASMTSTGTWYYVVWTYDNHVQKLYVDGTEVGYTITRDAASSQTTTAAFTISSRNGGGEFFDGVIDEVGIWDRALTQEEITLLYNSGDGLAINFTDDAAPTITLNSPSSANYTTTQDLTINFTTADDIGLSDLKLYVNGILNQTNASLINNSNSLFSLGLNDGNYTISGVVTDNNSATTNSSSIEVFIDATTPDINLTDPANVVIWEEGLNQTLNWSVYDLNLESCWYNYNGTNVSLNCSANTISFNYTGKNNLTFYANDSLGNLASELSSWDSYLVLEENNYSGSIYETGNTTLGINVSYDISSLSVSGILEYNGVNYTTIKAVEAGGAYFSKSFNIPAGRVGETNNFSWYFVITDGYNGTTSIGEFNQTIVETYLGYCNGTYTGVGLNFTYYDENSGEAINASANPTTYEGTFNYWIGDGTYTKNFSISDFNETNSSYSICISPNNSIKTNLALSYGAYLYNDNSYYLSEASLTNETNNIKLWLLPNTIGQKFYITAFYGISSLDGATITAAKYFDGEGVYKTTGIGETDSGGKFTMYLDPDKQYIFYGVSDGESIGSVEKGAFCESAPCEMSLQFFAESSGLLDGYEDIYAGDVVYSLGFNSSNDIATAVFSDTTGTASYFRFEVNRVSLNNTNLNVCDQTLYTTSGAMTCNMSGLTGNYEAKLVISRSPEKVVGIIQFIVGGLQDALGTTGLIVSLLFLIVIVFSGLRNPVIAVALVPVSLVFMKLIDILPISWLWIGSIAVLAFLLIGRLKT